MVREQLPDVAGPPADASVVLAAVAPRPWAPSFFGVVPERSIRRRPSDALQLVLAIVLVVASIVVTDGFTGVGTELYRDIAHLPEWLGSLGTALFMACTVGAVTVVLGALLLTRNLRLAAILLGVGLVGIAVSRVLISRIDIDAVRETITPDDGSLSTASVTWLAVATAVLLTAAPYLVRPARRAVRLVETLAVIGALIAAVGPAAAILASVGVGWAVSSVASLVIGTPRATPTLHSVERVLELLGVAIGDLKLAEQQTWGESRFVGVTPDGRPASVVVIGRDAADARFVHKLWRTIVYRDAGPTISVTRSAQLEHRAYLLLMAANAGVPVSEVVIAATAGPEDAAVLALIDPPGEPYDTVAVDDLTDDVLDGLWVTVERLHRARLSHGQLGASNLVLRPDGSTALLDLSLGSAGSGPELQAADRVDLLASTAVLVGNERALAAAHRSLGNEGISTLLPLLQTAALSKAVRRTVPEAKKRLKALREGGAALAESDEPKLTELRRVSPGSVVMAAATFVGFYLIVNQFAGVDLRDTLADAEPFWVAVAFALSFVPQFSGSVALMGTVSTPLPFGPVVAEQFANNFTGLIGGTVANTALVIRFFQKQGLEVAVAASSGVMNAVASSIVEVVLVTLGLIFTSTQFDLGSDTGSNIEQLIIIGIIVIGVAVSIAVLVPKLRNAVKTRVEPQVAAARDNLRGILTTPRKAIMIFGGNLCSQVAFALVIEASLHAYGASLPLLQVIVINSLATLVGGMAPIPGGLGVIEAGLIGGLTAAGIEQSTAVAATFTARMCTTYLPPIWGWVSLSWLRRHDYV